VSLLELLLDEEEEEGEVELLGVDEGLTIGS
jgi:hypothetical protein